MIETLTSVATLRLLAMALVALALARAGFMAWRAGERRREGDELRRLALLEHRERVRRESSHLESERAQRKLCWSGFREFSVERVVRPENESGSIASFYLAPCDGKELPKFAPGQFLTFRLKVPGAPKDVVRCYSLSDSHNPGRYRVSIKRVPKGVASNYFHDHVKEGDVLELRQPAGKFCVDLLDPTPVVLLGAGVGVTPMLSMLNGITAEQPDREVWFPFSNRCGEEIIQREHLEELSSRAPKARLHFLYSQPSAHDQALIAADPMHLEGRVERSLLEEVLPRSCVRTHQFYICGPGQMMEDTERDLLEWGVPSENIDMEAFGSGSVSALQHDPTGPVKGVSCEVRYARSGKTLTWSSDSGTLLEMAQKDGLDLEFGCGAGDCGTCQVTVRSGDVAYVREPPENPEAGTCLVCIAVPKTDVVLEA